MCPQLSALFGILGREEAGVKKKAWREVSMKTEILAGSGLQQ
jgi:hypothetical protein